MISTDEVLLTSPTTDPAPRHVACLIIGFGMNNSEQSVSTRAQAVVQQPGATYFSFLLTTLGGGSLKSS